MKKTFLIGLVPLVAFLAIPAASQALPHVYKNGVISGEGKILRTLEWGVVHLSTGTLGEAECHDVVAGFSENPVGGGNAVGKAQAFTPYECMSAECTKLGGKSIVLTSEHLPWKTEVIEPSASVFREKIGVKGEKGGGPGQSMEILVNCEGVTKGQLFGETAPLILNNGTMIGLKPGEIEFDQPGSGGLEGELGGGKLAAKLKQQGFAAQELIEVKNP